jgi:hypothetical protein
MALFLYSEEPVPVETLTPDRPRRFICKIVPRRSIFAKIGLLPRSAEVELIHRRKSGCGAWGDPTTYVSLWIL